MDRDEPVGICTGSVQGTAFRPRGHPFVRAVVSQLQTELARSSRDDERAGRSPGTHDNSEAVKKSALNDRITRKWTELRRTLLTRSRTARILWMYGGA